MLTLDRNFGRGDVNTISLTIAVFNTLRTASHLWVEGSALAVNDTSALVLPSIVVVVGLEAETAGADAIVLPAGSSSVLVFVSSGIVALGGSAFWVGRLWLGRFSEGSIAIGSLSWGSLSLSSLYVTARGLIFIEGQREAIRLMDASIFPRTTFAESDSGPELSRARWISSKEIMASG